MEEDVVVYIHHGAVLLPVLLPAILPVLLICDLFCDAICFILAISLLGTCLVLTSGSAVDIIRYRDVQKSVGRLNLAAATKKNHLNI